MYNEEEAVWIEQVRSNHDSNALSCLINKYRPMIDNMRAHYYIKSLDRNDWYQEAFWICYQTCNLFDGTTGSKFGSFFKMKFKHRVIDIIRKENSQKRKLNNIAEPLEKIDTKRLTIPSHRNQIELFDTLNYLAKKMTKTEIVALRYAMGHLSLRQACEQAQTDERQIRQAVYSCHRKIKKARELDLS